MFAMFNMIFTGLTSLFSGLNYFARSFERIGEATETMAATYSDEVKAKHNRQLTELARETKRLANVEKANGKDSVTTK